MVEGTTAWHAWAAGIIDGEGCIRLHRTPAKPGRSENYSLEVSVTNTDPRMIAKLVELFGGSTSEKGKPGILARKPIFVWRVSSCGSLKALKAVLPWLIAKKDQAEIALTWEQLRCVSGRRRSEPQVQKQRWLKEQLSTLKLQHNIAAG